MILSQFTWIQDTVIAAKSAGHIFPEMAACEAAEESAYGTSKLARDANNLFGMKQHAHPVFGTLSLPTREFLDNDWVVVAANWVKYPTVADCFHDRMATLEALKLKYPHYEAALTAPDAYAYIKAVSETWSTDPDRASKVQGIYNLYLLESSGGGIPTNITSEE